MMLTTKTNKGKQTHKDCTQELSYFFYTVYSVTTSFTEPYSLMKIHLTVFKIEIGHEITAYTIKGR